jgi:hypothetical protein
MTNLEKDTEKFTKDSDGFTQTWNTVGAGIYPTLEGA